MSLSLNLNTFLLISCFGDYWHSHFVGISCSTFPPSDLLYSHYESECGRYTSLSARVINGYEVKDHRMWMAKIKIKGSHCGGSILSQLHILTAAHCFCDTVLECDSNVVGKSKVLKGTSEITVLVGTTIISEGQPGLNIKQINIHPLYQTSIQPKIHDLAIITLTDPMTFSKYIGPICLPKAGTLELNITVLTAGWGWTRMTSMEYDTCSTDQYGPVIFQRCISENGKAPCETKRKAPATHICQKFWQKMSPTPKIQIYNLTFINGKSESCYYHIPGKNGWCFTNETKGNRDWGFCFKTCGKRMNVASRKLLEVKLHTYPLTNCYPGNVNPDLEICVGGKLRKPIVGDYIIIRKDNGTVDYRLTRKSNPEFYEFYGFKDSCRGDSGGPVWKNVKDEFGENRGTLIGVISRGSDCASMDKPGVVTRILPDIPWISTFLRPAFEKDQLLLSSRLKDNREESPKFRSLLSDLFKLIIANRKLVDQG